jgi:hypothetical protein
MDSGSGVKPRKSNSQIIFKSLWLSLARRRPRNVRIRLRRILFRGLIFPARLDGGCRLGGFRLLLLEDQKKGTQGPG